MEDLISIIIPVYNHTEHLQEVLTSLQKQTYGHIEIIVVDDGSTVPVDSSQFSIVSAIPCFWLRQENRGAPAARNYGFTQARGSMVIFWDADVIASPEMLEKLHRGLENHPEASYSYSDHYYGLKKFPSRAFDAEKLLQESYIPTMSLLRRSDFPGWDENLKRFQDWDLWLTLLEQGKQGVYVPGFLWRAFTKGNISTWLPSRAYTFPFKYFPLWYKKVKAYETAKRIVQEKHSLV